MRIANFKLRVCFFVFLAGTSLLTSAQQGDDVFGNGGNPHKDCRFGSNVHLIGEKQPDVGPVYTYTLINADAQELKRWEVIGAYSIDGNLAQGNNGVEVKTGNSINIVWDIKPGNNGGTLPNGKIIVEKEPGCPGDVPLSKVILPITPNEPAARKCGEKIIVNNDDLGTADGSHVCPGFEYLYEYFAGGACSNDATGANYRFEITSASEYSTDGGTTWQTGSVTTLTVDADSLMVKWNDSPQTKITAEPINGNKCCLNFGIFPHNRKLEADIIVRGWDMTFLNGFSTNDRYPLVSWGSNTISIHPEFNPNFAVDYKRVIYDPTTAGQCQLGTNTNDCITLTLDPNPFIQNVYWQAGHDILFGINAIVNPTSTGLTQKVYMNGTSVDKTEYAAATVQFNDGCSEQFIFHIVGKDISSCTPITWLGTPSILCSDPTALRTFSVDGGNLAGQIRWDIPAGWIPSNAYPVIVQQGLYPKTYWVCSGNQNELTVNTNGMPGNISATAINYSGCTNGTINSSSVPPYYVDVIQDLGAMDIHVPNCATIGELPKYRIKNAQAGDQFFWEFSSNSGPLGDGTSTGDAVVDINGNSLAFQNANNIYITVTSSNQCFSGGYTPNGVIGTWLPTNPAFVPVECLDENGQFMVQPDNGIATVGENVNDSYVGPSQATSNSTNQENAEAVKGQLSQNVKTNIFPNPASKFIVVEGNYQSYELLTLDGKLIAEGVMLDNKGKINTLDVLPGTYLVRLQGDNTMFTRKVRIVH